MSQAETTRMMREAFRAAMLGEGAEDIGEASGYGRAEVDLAANTTRATAKVETAPSYGFFFPSAGNPNGARLVADFGGGGRLDVLVPGALGTAPFRRLLMWREANSVTTGIARLVIFRSPRAFFYQPDSGPGSQVTQGPTAIGPAGAATQASGAIALGGNIPTAATDGIPAQGLRAVKIFVSAAAAQTLNATAGRLVQFWWFDGAVSRWRISDVSISPNNPAGVRDWASGDVEISVPANADRFYAEVNVWVTSGAGAMVVGIEGSYQL